VVLGGYRETALTLALSRKRERGNGERERGNGKWERGNGKWERRDGERERGGAAPC